MVKTAVFKLHNPSKTKRAVLQQAFKNYHLLCDDLVRAVAKCEDEFFATVGFKNRKGKITYNPKNTVNHLNRTFKSVSRSYQLPSGLKEAAQNDIARSLISYKELLKERSNTTFPAYQILNPEDREEVFGEALRKIQSCGDLTEENTLRDELSRLGRDRAQYRPLMFPRCDTAHKNMTLLFNPHKKTYSALLHVAPKRNKKLVIAQEHGLHDVRSGELYLAKRGTATGVLFPLEMGERVVRRFLHEGEPKEGKLVYKPEEDAYYLHVAFEFQPDEVETETNMGIDRGVVALAAWSVLNHDNAPVAQGKFDGAVLHEYLKRLERKTAEAQRKGKSIRSAKRGRWADAVIHEVVNEIVGVASKNRAQVYVEDLKNITDRSQKRKRSTFNKQLNRAQYTKFLMVLDYKLQAVGLPPTKSVRPAYTSMTCAICGHRAPENRPKQDEYGKAIQDVFKCVVCGHEDNADQNASRIIAMKGPWHYMPKADKKKQQVETFDQYLSMVLF